ncbi:MAG: hypothetical protein IPF73_12710 [Betaproteobacteria bacterium]|nr:hypothetical protein [Betaproteobacteria bacterium]
MNIRTFLGFLGLAAALGAGNAVAQQGTVARLSNLEGNVMVSQGDGMVAAVRGQRVAPGTRVVTMAGGKAVVNYDVGCDISLKENQRFTVRMGECALLLGEVVTLVPGSATVAVAGVGVVEVVSGIVIGGGLIYGGYETFRGSSASPN